MEHSFLTVNDNDIKSSYILIVDDDPLNVSLISELLSAHGFKHIIACHSGEEAIEIYREHIIDLMLLDLKMPDIDGYQVMDEVNNTEKELRPPIIVVTGLYDLSTSHQVFAQGANDIITKPFDETTILCRVQSLLNIHLSRKKVFQYGCNLERTIKQRTDELLDTQMQVVKHLTTAAEYRDTQTGAHTVRVAWYAAILGEHYGLSSNTLELLFHAAPMHDIGKIGIPDDILLKPHCLNRYEWDVMKTHPTIGAKILANNTNPLIETAQVIALTHHEKWDGSGYPNGYKGEQIPILGRLVMIADVFDALITSRPYKEPWSLEDTIAFIERESGASFDPELVNIFMKIYPKFIEIKEEYQD